MMVPVIQAIIVTGQNEVSVRTLDGRKLNHREATFMR